MYGHAITPSKPRHQSKTHLFNTLMVALAAAEANFALLQPIMPINTFQLLAFLLPVGNMVLREYTDRAVGVDGAGITSMNHLTASVLIVLGFALIASLFFMPGKAQAAERNYSAAWCAKHGGRHQARMPDGTRADCLTRTHAVEVDHASNWYEGFTQALHYARVTDRRPGLVLIMGPGDQRFVERANKLASLVCPRVDVWVVPP